MHHAHSRGPQNEGIVDHVDLGVIGGEGQVHHVAPSGLGNGGIAVHVDLSVVGDEGNEHHAGRGGTDDEDPTPRSMGTARTTPQGGDGATRGLLVLCDHPLAGCGGTHYGDCRACGSGWTRGGWPGAGDL